MEQVTNRRLATAALVGQGFFVAVVAALPFVQGSSYRVVRQAVSELALGRGGWLIPTAFCVMAVGTAAFAQLLRRTTGARVAPVLLTLMAVLDVVSAAFPAVRYDAHLTNVGRVHIAAGILSFVSVIAAMYASIRPMRRSPEWLSYARVTLGFAVVSTLAMVLLGPGGPLGQAHFGIGQRGTVAPFVTWVLVTSLRALRRSAPAPAVAPSRADGLLAASGRG